jgi:hypothetical protein
MLEAAGIGGGFDVDEAELASVGAFVEVGHGHGVGVVPAGAGGAGGEGVMALARDSVEAGRHKGAALFFGAVDFGGDEHAVPVD